MNEGLEDATERSGPPAQRHGGGDGPVGWVAAHRLLTGQPVGPAADALRALLAAAAAPAAAERDQAPLNILLDAYRQAEASPAAGGAAAAPGPAPTAPGGRVQRRVSRAMAVKCATVLLVAVGTGAAAAGSNMLPASIQRVAHDYFGGLGVPAPSTGPGSPGAQASASPAPQPSASAVPPAGATPISDLITLCGRIPHGSKNWRTALDAQDQSKLSAAAGGELKVTSFCAQLLQDSGTGSGTGSGSDTSSGANANATPSPGASGSESAAASPGDDGSGKLGKGKDTHSPSPNPHSTVANH